MKQEVRLGVIGVGNVGAAFINLVNERADTIAQRTGISLVVTRASVRDLSRARGVALDAKAFTTDPFDVVNDPNVDVVVELMGGISLHVASLRKHSARASRSLLPTKHFSPSTVPNFMLQPMQLALTFSLKRLLLAASHSYVRCARACVANPSAG